MGTVPRSGRQAQLSEKLIHDMENRANDFYKGNLVLTKENLTFGGTAELM